MQGKTPFEILVALIKDVGVDAASRDRIALASTFSHGESAWVAETAWQAAQRGLHVKREATVGEAARVDLEVAGTAVEFKSTFGAWALKPGLAAERDRWLGKDVDKLMAGACWARGNGIRGFVPFSDLPTAGVPKVAGVYVVLRESTDTRPFVRSARPGGARSRTPP